MVGGKSIGSDWRGSVRLCDWSKEFLRICTREGDIEDWGLFDWSIDRDLEKKLIGRERRGGL